MTEERLFKFEVTITTTCETDTTTKFREALHNGIYRAEMDGELCGVTGYSTYHVSTTDL